MLTDTTARIASGRRQVQRRTIGWSLPMRAALAAAVAGSAVAQTPPTTFKPYIVNGTITSGHPTTGALLIYDDASQSSLNSFCSGTLIGCQTFLTAAHCVCPDNTNDAQACQRQGLNEPSTLRVFLQHGGLIGVTQVDINPDYAFGQGGDLAIITLSEPVTGIAPSPINTVQQPAAGTSGTIVGFGSTAGGRNGIEDAGIKRDGAIAVGVCTGGVPGDTNVCWSFLGTGANTCEGDSGGPLFVDFGTGDVLAGVTSGGGSTCQAPDLPFDTDVFAYRGWIASQGGAGVSSMPCGTLTPVGAGSTAVIDSSGQLSASQPEARWNVTVPAGTGTLRIALNGVPWSGPGGQTTNDFDLYVRFGSAPTTSEFDCSDTNPTPFGFCEFTAPAAGTWSVLARQISGSGLFQLTATTFGQAASNVCPGDCNDDGVVTVDELLTSVNIALGNADISACPAGDVNGDGTITVDELLAAVNSALNDC